MKKEIKAAHIRHKSTSGKPIDFIVFGIKPSSYNRKSLDSALNELILKARNNNYKIDQAALVYMQNNKTTFWGSLPLVDFLSKNGVPQLKSIYL